MTAGQPENRSLLRTRREALGLSAKALADQASVSERSIYRYEGGEWSQIQAVLRIAKILGCTVAELVGEDADSEMAALRAENATLKAGIEEFIASMPSGVRKMADRAGKARGDANE